MTRDYASKEERQKEFINVKLGLYLAVSDFVEYL